MFKYLQHFREISLLRFADQQMYVLGHHHVTDQQKSESRASLVQYLHKTVPRARCSKKPPASITTEGDEMKISASVKPPQRIAHKRTARAADAERSKPAPLNTTSVRHPRVHLRPTKDSTRMIYSLGVLEEQDIVKKSLRHPPQLVGRPAGTVSRARASR